MRHDPVRRLTLLVFVGTFLFYLPFLGSYGLFDPWETHYSEVARSMIQQDDYISTFWQDNGFFSKPVLTFWLQATGMRVAGLDQANDIPDEMVRTSAPEWAVRTPVALLGAMGVAFLFWLLARFFGVFAGGAGALLLAATPFYALVARQTITDMPFVAFTTAAMAFFIAGLLYDPKREAPETPPEGRKGRWCARRDPLFFVVAVFLGLLVLSQYVLMASHVDASFVAVGRRFELSGWLVFLPYLILLADVLVSVFRDPEGRGKLYILTGFAFTGLGILAKGFGALFIPVVVFMLYFLVTGEWSRLRRLDFIRGLFVVIAVSFPWHHAMIIRHGGAFFQEYFIHHHFKRAAMGVHGERGLFTYYINQLFFGALPLVPLLPGALGRLVTGKVLPRRLRVRDDRQRATLLLALWALVAFFLFSFMLTKFHHYILPAVVPLAALCGIYLADLRNSEARLRVLPLIVGLIVFAFILRELFLDPAHMLNLFIYKYERLFPYEQPFALWFAILGGCIALATVVLMLRPRPGRPLFIAVTVLFAGYLIYSYIPRVAPHWSQKALHRIYFDCRTGPKERFIAWQLNWRGENFYSKNKVLPYMELDNKEFFAHIDRYRSHTPGVLSGRFLILESAKRFKKLKSDMNLKYYTRYPDVYQGKNADSFIKIIGPGCKEIPEEWNPHFRQRNWQVLTHPYPHNKFMLVRMMI